MPTLTQLEYVLAVHQTGHFGRAAEVCHVSQPTLSAQIKKAEEELGVVLFDRNARPIAVTEPGRPLIELAREVVSAHERLVATAQGSRGELAGHLTLGIIPTLAPFVLPWFLGDFARQHPKVELNVLERPTETLLEEIAANRMDAAVLATPTGSAGLQERVLFYDPFYVYADARSPLLAEDSIEVDALEPDRIWLLEDGHCFRAQVVHLCHLEQHQQLGNVEYAGGTFETLCRLVDSTGGYTLVPETFARTLPADVRLRNVRPIRHRVPTREVSLIHHRSSWKTAMLDALEQSIVDRLPRVFSREVGEGEVLPIVAP